MVPKEYIEMCEQAKEIQDLWTPAAWDYVYGFQRHATICRKKDVRVISGYETDGGYYGLGIHDYKYEYIKIDFIWLPRQDQLQKIIGLFPLELVGYINRYISVDEYSSWEILLLEVCMEIKFNKVWGGKTWVLA